MPTLTLGPLSGYLARPTSSDGPWPGLIVVQEWWGLNDNIRNVADRFAAEGYLAFAPDVYHGELAQVGENEKAMALMQKYGLDAPQAIHGVYPALRAHPDCNGKIGAVGFCFGGRMALNLAILEPGLKAACTFYGGRMEMLFDKLGAIRCPVLGLFGDADVSIPVGAVEQFDKLLTGHNIPHEVKVYPNSGHAFFRDDDPQSYRPQAAADAWERVRKFFKANLN
ncbi:MAG: dienelactone hydrolase family protein [Chloroflexi bacterium]|nr:dienelactone hydrolase family protein [Chloroflexota bacterium]